MNKFVCPLEFWRQHKQDADEYIDLFFSHNKAYPTDDEVLEEINYPFENVPNQIWHEISELVSTHKELRRSA